MSNPVYLTNRPILNRSYEDSDWDVNEIIMLNVGQVTNLTISIWVNGLTETYELMGTLSYQVVKQGADELLPEINGAFSCYSQSGKICLYFDSAKQDFCANNWVDWNMSFKGSVLGGIW